MSEDSTFGRNMSRFHGSIKRISDVRKKALKSEPLVNVDVLKLLDRLDEVDPREGIRPRDGRWLVDRWWKLIVWVIPDHRPLGRGLWKPGISIYCCDPDGRFSTGDFVEFDECRLTESQIQRMFAFIDRWEERHRQFLAKHQRSRKRRPVEKGGAA